MFSDGESEGPSSSPNPDDGNVGSDLRQGHEVGSPRIRGSQRRSLNMSPYLTSSPSSSPSLLPGFDTNSEVLQGDAAGILSRRVPSEPSIQGETRAGYQMEQMRSLARFGQPSLPSVQPTFGQPGFAQLTQARFGQGSQGISASSINLPAAFQSSASELASFAPGVSQSGQRPAFNQGGTIPIPKPTPRPGVEYIYEPGGLPSARRVAVSQPPVNPAQLSSSVNLSESQDAGSRRGSGSSSSSGSSRDSQGRGSPPKSERQDTKGKGRAYD
jgi:hypothetical protein